MTVTYRLTHPEALKNCITDIRSHDLDGTYEVIVRKIVVAKTLAQLGGLFGCWIKHLADKGESEDYIHRMLKAKFLARIYGTDQQNAEQEQWVELLAVYQMSGQQDKLLKHAKRISLSWCTLPQMKEYLNAIEAHYQSIGEPLPIFDKYRKYR